MTEKGIRRIFTSSSNEGRNKMMFAERNYGTGVAGSGGDAGYRMISDSRGERCVLSRGFRGGARQGGFTLIEIMVVIIILGILAMYVAPKLMGRPDEAKQVRAKMDISALETALKLYKLDSGMYPNSEQGLQALVQKPESGAIPKKWRTGGYLEKGKVPKDPWGNDYVYLSPGLKGDFDILSYGADGVPGGENENKDINNWESE
jgi:general secretion pathway protein G